ncbi:nicastrin-like [Planococcus citri]|uniref:nicastrin-like n=1 Tax=Planococcus citri TaxID=170843 RepID=UPI0031F8CEB8
MYTLIMYALILICVLASYSTAFQSDSKMYSTLDQTSPCVLRMNGTHTFGCTSPRQGNNGVLHVVRNVTDFLWVLNSSPMDSYTVLINNDMFTRQYLQKMNASSKISGILLAQDQSRSEIKPTSPEDTCPNRYSGLARRENMCEKPWNTIGTGILLERWDMPIFFTKDNDTITQLHDCFRRNAPYDESQTSRSLCALQLSSHMFGAVDSRTCLRRNAGTFNTNPITYCTEMGNENIYLPIIPLDKFKPTPKSYVVVAARLDATSFFYKNNPASLSVATSLTTLILTAKLLYDMTKGQDFSKYHKNVVFMLFNGEAYDYIGSSRVVYDLKENQYPSPEHPILIDEIDLYLELSQLYNSEELYYHNTPNVSSFITSFNQTLKKHNLMSSTRSTLPSSALQNFLLVKKDFPGVLLSSYNDEFTNKYYHSLFDDDYNINYKYVGKNQTVPDDSIQSFVANFATSLAATLYQQISNSTPNASATITKEEADELLHCYVDTLSCDLIKEMGASSFLPEDIISSKIKGIDYYVGVITKQTQWINVATQLFLIFFSSYKTNSTNYEQCANLNAYWIPSKNICLKSELNVTAAFSPAFVIENYNMTSGEYPTWTESQWNSNNIKVRMFMQPSRRYEWLVFIVGILTFCGSFAFTYLVKKNAKELFDYPNLISASNI